MMKYMTISGSFYISYFHGKAFTKHLIKWHYLPHYRWPQDIIYLDISHIIFHKTAFVNIMVWWRNDFMTSMIWFHVSQIRFLFGRPVRYRNEQEIFYSNNKKLHSFSVMNFLRNLSKSVSVCIWNISKTGGGGGGAYNHNTGLYCPLHAEELNCITFSDKSVLTYNEMYYYTYLRLYKIKLSHVKEIWRWGNYMYAHQSKWHYNVPFDITASWTIHEALWLAVHNIRNWYATCNVVWIWWRLK